MPATVRKGNWEAETLSNLQLTCSALDAWIAREALCYLGPRLVSLSQLTCRPETLTRRPAPRDDSLPSEARQPTAPLLSDARAGPGPRATGQQGGGCAAPPRRLPPADPPAGGQGRARHGPVHPQDRRAQGLHLSPSCSPADDRLQPGAEAHWVWRGTRVSNRHIQSYCQAELGGS
eukprot:759141-Hanusia_phi.AAC.7